MKKKILSLLTAFAMVFGIIAAPFTSAKANEPETTNSVTLHKLLMDKATLEGWDKDFSDKLEKDGYNGTQDLAALKQLNSLSGKTVSEIEGVYFAWAKKDTEDDKYYWIKSDDSFTATKTEAVEGKLDSIPDDTFGDKTGANGKTFTTTNFKGEYKIFEIHNKSEYVGKNGETLTDMRAVPVEITLPLVNKTGVVENAHVYPKNTEEKPDTNKDFTKEFENGKNGRSDADKESAAAETHNVGDVIDYTVTTKVPAKTKWKTAFWDDKMTEGLTYITKDAATDDLAGKGISIKYGDEDMDASWYTLDETSGNGFTLKLTDKGLKEIANATEDKTIRLDYHAVLNEKAVVAIPESNDVTFHYGNNEDHGNTPVPNKPNDNGELTITKDWAEGTTKKDVTFTLYNAQTGKQVKNTEVETVEGYKFENPVTIKAGDKMEYTWKGLNKNIEYKVVETHIDGYSVEYGKTAEAGGLTAKNHKDNNPKPINPNEPKVKTYGAKFVKTNEDGSKRLKDAKFVLKNDKNQFLTGQAADRKAYEEAQTAFVNAVKAYNALEAEKQTKEEREKVQKLEKARDDAWNATLQNMTKWEGTSKEDSNNIKFTANELGQFEIAGLAPGTYTLVEVDPPKDYALPTNAEFAFTIEANGNVTSEKMGTIDFGINDDTKDDNAEKIVNKKVSIPQTGGIGSLIFIVAGAAIMIGAFVAYKKSQAVEA